MMSFSDALKLGAKALQDIVAKGGPDARMAQAELDRRATRRAAGGAGFVPSPQSAPGIPGVAAYSTTPSRSNETCLMCMGTGVDGQRICGRCSGKKTVPRGTSNKPVPLENFVPKPAPVPEPDVVAAAAQVPMMITRRMEADLISLGYSESAIGKMTPAAAWRIIQNRIRAVNNPSKKRMTREDLERAHAAVEQMFVDQKTVVNTRFAPQGPKPKGMRYIVLVPDADFREDKYMDIIQTNDYVLETEKEVVFINGVGVANGMVVIDTHAGALNWQLPVSKQPPDLSHLWKKK